ncbi:MAG: AMP-binding protein, partial [Candidatus Krumholzibacteriota bacterium]|nr:AMP-binding protein [Candidatus Krumholzibacteriota bacterium]
AALRPDVEKSLFAAGLPLLQGYGLTEASPVVAVNPLAGRRAGTVGPALPGVEVEIENPGPDGIGEIIVRGANVMKEYYRNPEFTGQVLRRGYLYTGDLGKMDEDGYITICGRKKSVIVTAGGKNIYPDEIEGLLNRSPFILECLVLPVEDQKGNTRPGVVVVPDYDSLGQSRAPDGNLTESGIREILAAEIKRICEELPEYKHIIDFQIRDNELPKTTTQKIKRHLVKWLKE